MARIQLRVHSPSLVRIDILAECPHSIIMFRCYRHLRFGYQWVSAGRRFAIRRQARSEPIAIPLCGLGARWHPRVVDGHWLGSDDIPHRQCLNHEP